MPVSFTVNRSTVLRTDSDGDGFADAGDVLRHTLTVTNTGDTDALAVIINDLLGGSTETGLVNISPIAFNDAFNAVGNTLLEVGNATAQTGPQTSFAGNLLSNDVGSTTVGVGALAADDVTGFTISAFQATSANGGAVNVITSGVDAGSFTYVSAAGFTGTDTFTYTIRDAGIDGVAGNADDTTSTATVTITVSNQVWYIDSTAGAGGNGTSTNPYNSAAVFAAANVDGANDYIHVRGATTGNLVLETGERLIGTGSALVVGADTLFASTGSNSDLTGSSGFTVTLAGGGTGNNTIAGIDINSSGAGNGGITGTSFGTLTVNGATIDASGQGLILSTGAIAGTGFTSVDSDGGTNNVSLTGVTGTLALGGGALSGATGTAFNVSGGSVTTTYSGNVSQASASQALVSVTGGHTGTLTFSSGTLSATNGTGLQFDNADGTYNFNGTNTLNGGDAGVDIVNGSGGNFSFSTNSSIINGTGIAFNVNGGAGNIDYNGTIAHTANTRAISVQNHTGGTVSFDGTVSATGSSDGILLATNTGAIINLTGQLTINAAGANFDASGGGTVTATALTNVISSGTATALSVVNTNIGLGGLNFVSITSNGAASGIVLNNTGTTAGVHGGLTVTGDSGSAVNASGGTISASTGVGISLNSTRGVSLDQMTVQNGLNDGINGANVTNFSLSNSTINNNGDALQEHGAQFDTVLGNVTFNNVSFTNNETSQLTIINTSGTANVSIVNSDFSSTGLAAAPNGLHGVHMETQGTAAADLMITGSDFNNLFSNSIHATNEGTGTFEITVATSTFNNVGAGAINIVQNNSGTVRFYVHDNGTFLRGTNTGSSHSININQAGGVPAGAVMEGRISNNVIGNNTSSTSANSGGDGIRVLSVGSGTTTVQIDNNNVQGVGANGINVQMSEDANAAHTMNATIFNNVVSATDINSFDGIRVVAGSVAGDVGILRLDMHNNTAHSATANDFTVRQRFGTTVQLLNYAGGSTDTAAVQTYLDVTRANDPSAPAVWFITTQAPGGGFVTTASVPAPTLPSPLLAVTPPPAPPAPPADDTKGDATGGEYIPPTPPSDSGDQGGQPVVNDDGILSQAELALIAEAAIQRWADAGATAEQIAAMRAVTFSVENMSGLQLGSSSAGHIAIDDNAAGFNWFVDATPGEDSEYSGSGTQLVAPDGTVAGARMDLLTTIMHELGHQIGLGDIYNSDDRDELMYGSINPGERRLPGNDDLTGASGAPLTGTAFILSPISIGTIPAGRIVVVQWDSTVNAYTNQIIPTFSNTATVSGSNFVSATSNPNTMGPAITNDIDMDSLTLGGTVWLDNGAGGGIVNNGLLDGTEAGINNVSVTLFADTNANGVFDAGTDTQVGSSILTAGGGLYSFANLAPGNYIVRIDAANFATVLSNRVTSPGGPDPDNNQDNDDNGVNGAGGIVVSQAITLAHNTETTADGTGQLDINNTLDFGFVPLNVGPTNNVPGTRTINEDATQVFSGASLISITDPDAGSGPITVTLGVAHGALTLASTVGINFDAGANGSGAMTITGTLAAINAALNGMTYAPTADFNGADTLTITTSDNGNTGADPGLTGGANDEQDSDSVTINITAINDAPTIINGATQGSTTIAEDQPLAAGESVTSLFNAHFSDAADQVAGGSSANTLAGVAVTANGSSGATGQWQYSTNGGGSWQNIGAVTDATARLYNAGTLLRFNPTLDYNGAEPTLTVHLVDTSGAAITDNALVNLSGGGATGGITRYSSGIVDLGGTITAVNDTPVNTVPGTQTINEDATLTFTGGTAISVNDPDVGAGNLTVTLSVLNGQLTLSSTAGLSFTGGSDGTDDTTMTFSGTQAAINTALNGLLYETTLDYNGSDTLTIVTNDNGNTGTPGALQDMDSVTINITAVADVVNDTQTISEDSGPYTLDLLGNDTFENPGRSITAVTQGLHGFVAISDNNTIGDTSDDYVVYTPVADYNGTDSFTYTVTSGGVTEVGTVNVTITAVADIAVDIATVGEDSGATTIDVIANDTFENGGFSITAVTQGLHGTVTIIDGPDADLNPDYVTYTPNADYNGSDSFTYTVTSGGVTEIATVVVTINAVADIADDSVNVLQDSVNNALNLLANDTFESAGRAITAVGAALHGTTSIDNNGTGDPTDDFVRYTPTGGYSGPDTFTYTVTSGGVMETATVTVNVGAPNATPVIDLDGGAPPIDNTALYTEQAAPTVLANALTVTDADDTNIESATVQITSGLIVSFDYLTVNGATNGTLLGITFNYNGATGVLTLTGSAPLADYQTVLRQVGFESTSDSPGTSRQISWVVNDGNIDSTAAVTTITVTPVNDAPLLDLNGAGAGTSATLNYTENAAVTPIAPAATVTDDSTDYNNSRLIITIANGFNSEDVLTIINQGTGPGQIGYSSGSITYEGVMIAQLLPAMSPFPVLDIQFQGTPVSQAAAQALLQAIGYSNTSDNPTVSPARTVTFQFNDGDGIANGGAAIATQNATINITAVNDAATITGTVTGDVTEAGGINNGTAGVPTASADLGATDPDNPADSWTATASPQASIGGYGTYELTANGVWTYTLDDNDAAVQALNGAATLTDTFSVTTVDGTAQTITITIHAQDDAATAQPDAFTTPENVAVSGNVVLDNGAGADSDPDSAGTPTVSEVNGSAVAVGMQITLPSGALLTVNANGTFNYNPNGAFDATPTVASGASNTPAQDSFSYTLAGGGTTTVTLTLTGIDTDDTLIGTAGADLLLGGNGIDTIYGLGGADLLAGQAGIDTMSGGDGDDRYVLDDPADVVIETAGQGYDIVYTTASYVLDEGNSIEVLSSLDPSATDAVTLRGNALDNWVLGNNGDDLLIGGYVGLSGVDRLVGFAGDDRYIIDDAADLVVEAEGQGYDIVYTTASYFLDEGNSIEVLSALDSASTNAMTLVGNSFDNWVHGNDGANFLSGGTIGASGIDRLVGFGGDDRYIVDNAADLVVEAAGGGFDVLYTTSSYVLDAGNSIEVLSALDPTTTNAMNLTGNELDNVLVGNSGANLIDGKGGNDVLYGTNGADIFAFSTALGAGNVDTIVDFFGASSDGDDTIRLDHNVFTGLLGGPLAANAFVVGTQAQDADDRIIYDSATGALYFDADGAGGAAAVQFAILSASPALGSSDFIVI